MEADKEAVTMAGTSGQEVSLAVIRKSREAVTAAAGNVAETARTDRAPQQT